MKNKVLYRSIQLVLLILYLGLMVFFVVKCLETGVESKETSQKVVEVSADVVNTVSHEEKVSAQDQSFQYFIRKLIGHFGYFVLLGTVSIFLYLSITKYKKYIWVIIHYVVGIGFAFISEFQLQGRTAGRTASIKDVGIDSLGFISLSTIILLIYFILCKKRKSLS